MSLYQELKETPDEELPSIFYEPVKNKQTLGLFEVGNRIFPYFKPTHEDISYGARAVEIPVALHLYNRQRSESSPSEGRILEIGNVLPKYIPSWQNKLEDVQRGRTKSYVFPHICLTPEKGNANEGIIHKGLTEANLEAGKFDLILSISTLALCLRDEPSKIIPSARLDRMLLTVTKLRRALSPRGVLLLSLPWEYSFPDLSQPGDSDAVIHHYLEAFHIDDNSEEDEAPNLIWKMNRMGYGLAGNRWKEVDILKSPNIVPDEHGHPPSAKTIYFMLWGATEIW